MTTSSLFNCCFPHNWIPCHYKPHLLTVDWQTVVSVSSECVPGMFLVPTLVTCILLLFSAAMFLVPTLVTCILLLFSAAMFLVPTLVTCILLLFSAAMFLVPTLVTCILLLFSAAIELQQAAAERAAPRPRCQVVYSDCQQYMPTPEVRPINQPCSLHTVPPAHLSLPPSLS